MASITFSPLSSSSNTAQKYLAEAVEDALWQCMLQGRPIDETTYADFLSFLPEMPSPFEKHFSRPYSIFTLAIRAGYPSILEKMILFSQEKGLTIAGSIRRTNGPQQANTLHVACRPDAKEGEENLQIVHMLLAAGISPFICSMDGLSPFHCSILGHKTKIMETIVQYIRETVSPKAALDLLNFPTDNSSKDTPLHLACVVSEKVERNDQMIPFLLEAGASPFVLNGDGLSPLCWAIDYRNAKAVETIVFHAQKNGYLQELLEQKSELKNYSPMTAREMALLMRADGIADMLLQAEYHLKNPIMFPLFPKTPSYFPDLETPFTLSFSDHHHFSPPQME